MSSESNSTQARERTGFEMASPKDLLDRDDLTREEKVEMLRQFCGGHCRAQWERAHAEEVGKTFEERSGVERG